MISNSYWVSFHNMCQAKAMPINDIYYTCYNSCNYNQSCRTYTSIVINNLRGGHKYIQTSTKQLVTGLVKIHHIYTQWQRTFSSSINSSINKLTSYCHNTSAKLTGGFFLRLVSEACQASTSAGVLLNTAGGLYRQPPC